MHGELAFSFSSLVKNNVSDMYIEYNPLLHPKNNNK